MAKQRPVRPVPARVDRALLKTLLLGVDDTRLDRILALKPTPDEVEEAVLWLDGKTNAFIAKGRLPAGATIGIVSILAEEEERRSS